MKIEYRYNAEGLRIQKIVTKTTASGTTTTTDYILHGKNIIHLIQGNDKLHFFYDASNKPAIVEFNGTKYGYVQNLQGDVCQIVDTNGNVVVEYTYDAWGKVLNTTGSMAGSLGVIRALKQQNTSTSSQKLALVLAVNRRVVGSSPTWGARVPLRNERDFFVCREGKGTHGFRRMADRKIQKGQPFLSFLRSCWPSFNHSVVLVCWITFGPEEAYTDLKTV